MERSFSGFKKGFLKTAKPNEKPTKGPHPKEDAKTTQPTSGASSSADYTYMMLGQNGLIFSDQPEGLQPFTKMVVLETNELRKQLESGPLEKAMS